MQDDSEQEFPAVSLKNYNVCSIEPEKIHFPYPHYLVLSNTTQQLTIRLTSEHAQFLSHFHYSDVERLRSLMLHTKAGLY